jgi:hypothetical protein
MCGSKKIDEHVFCLGVDVLEDVFKARPDLHGLICSINFLIREATFRPAYSMSSSGRPSLDTCSLAELLDMYHAHEATKRHDKVYALLGMSSDDLTDVNLLPNYSDPWDELLQRLTNYLLGEELSVEVCGDKEIAAIRHQVYILGRVSSVLRNTASNDIQKVDITLKNTPDGPKHWRTERWTLRPSAKFIRQRDVICILQGASTPMIIRFCEDHFTIIRVAAVPLEIVAQTVE